MPPEMFDMPSTMQLYIINPTDNTMKLLGTISTSIDTTSFGSCIRFEKYLRRVENRTKLYNKLKPLGRKL